ncbi:MAG: type IIL restriction-modification enzyme MmeI, partial [Halanaerobiaceae bacterium]
MEKAQKFLDRIIFICFCEDKGLLPNDLLHEAIKRGKDSFSPSETPIWDQIRGVFRAIDKGNPNHNINAYNGGLFEYDEILDDLVIENEFFEAVYDISDYDFDSDVDVNILGHIFE